MSRTLAVFIVVVAVRTVQVEAGLKACFADGGWDDSLRPCVFPFTYNKQGVDSVVVNECEETRSLAKFEGKKNNPIPAQNTGLDADVWCSTSEDGVYSFDATQKRKLWGYCFCVTSSPTDSPTTEPPTRAPTTSVPTTSAPSTLREDGTECGKAKSEESCVNGKIQDCSWDQTNAICIQASSTHGQASPTPKPTEPENRNAKTQSEIVDFSMYTLIICSTMIGISAALFAYTLVQCTTRSLDHAEDDISAAAVAAKMAENYDRAGILAGCLSPGMGWREASVLLSGSGKLPTALWRARSLMVGLCVTIIVLIYVAKSPELLPNSSWITVVVYASVIAWWNTLCLMSLHLQLRMPGMLSPETPMERWLIRLEKMLHVGKLTASAYLMIEAILLWFGVLTAYIGILSLSEAPESDDDLMEKWDLLTVATVLTALTASLNGPGPALAALAVWMGIELDMELAASLRTLSKVPSLHSFGSAAMRTNRDQEQDYPQHQTPDGQERDEKKQQGYQNVGTVSTTDDVDAVVEDNFESTDTDEVAAVSEKAIDSESGVVGKRRSSWIKSARRRLTRAGVRSGPREIYSAVNFRLVSVSQELLYCRGRWGWIDFCVRLACGGFACAIVFLVVTEFWVNCDSGAENCRKLFNHDWSYYCLLASAVVLACLEVLVQWLNQVTIIASRKSAYWCEGKYEFRAKLFKKSGRIARTLLVVELFCLLCGTVGVAGVSRFNGLEDDMKLVKHLGTALAVLGMACVVLGFMTCYGHKSEMASMIEAMTRTRTRNVPPAAGHQQTRNHHHYLDRAPPEAFTNKAKKMSVPAAAPGSAAIELHAKLQRDKSHKESPAKKVFHDIPLNSPSKAPDESGMANIEAERSTRGAMLRMIRRNSSTNVKQPQQEWDPSVHGPPQRQSSSLMHPDASNFEQPTLERNNSNYIPRPIGSPPPLFETVNIHQQETEEDEDDEEEQLATV